MKKEVNIENRSRQIRRVEEESTAKTNRKKRKTERISKGIQTETETKGNR
jgi:hypothetical protein